MSRLALNDFDTLSRLFFSTPKGSDFMLNRRSLFVAACLVLPFMAAVTSSQTAQSAGVGIQLKSSVVAVEPGTNSWGHHPVYIWTYCAQSTTCKGEAAITKQKLGTNEDFEKYSTYSIPARSSGYILLWWLKDEPLPTDVEPNVLTKTIKIHANGTGASETMRFEKRVLTAKIEGDVAGPSAGVTDIKVHRWRVSGLTSTRYRTLDVANGGSFDFGSFPLGRNNAAQETYRVSVSAKVNGVYREWFWRGSDNASRGGGRSIREASGVAASKKGPFNVKIRFGTISGALMGPGADGADVRAIAPPVSMPTRDTELRNLDVPYCANEFGRDRDASGGSFSFPFLPWSDTTDRRYLIAFNPEGSPKPGVLGASGFWADCHAAKNYSSSTSDDDLIAVSQSSTSVGLGSKNMTTGKSLSVKINNPSGLGPNDKWTTLRYLVPGGGVLDEPLVPGAAGPTTNSEGNKITFTGLYPGRYRIEIGRRMGCSDWYPSVYSNNDAYLQGEDRGAEAWKSFGAGSPQGDFPTWSELWKKPYEVDPNPFAGGEYGATRNPGSGKKGWMYRDACKSVVAGEQTWHTVSDAYPDATWSFTMSKGATVSGHVSRVGGKSNKEMLVTLYSTGGTLVQRSAYTNSSGNFKIYGLESGNYRVGVNLDSWRGIGRDFSGTKTKRVTAGHGYSVGTLYFKK
jgi:hypothetical protein